MNGIKIAYQHKKAHNKKTDANLSKKKYTITVG